MTDSVRSSCLEAWLAFAERKIQQENRVFLEGVEEEGGRRKTRS